MRATVFIYFVQTSVLAYSSLGTPFKPCLPGPAGYPRECFSLIGTRLTGHPALGALDFHP
jgi:hypothetical protein